MGLAWFAAYSIYMVTQVLYEDISLTTKLVLSLISNTAMGYAFQMLVMCEGTSEGMCWHSVCIFKYQPKKGYKFNMSVYGIAAPKWTNRF